MSQLLTWHIQLYKTLKTKAKNQKTQVMPLPKSTSKPNSTNHSFKAQHVTKSSVNQTLEDLGVDKHDTSNIEQITNLAKGVPSKTRHIKENAFTTIVNIQDKWQRHKQRTNSMLKEAKDKILEEKAKFNALQAETVEKDLENDKLRNDLERLENVCQELTALKANEHRAIREKEELSKESSRLKSKLTEFKEINERQKGKIENLENEKAKIAFENSNLKRGFQKMQHKADSLERELKETRVELEMFEEMLSSIPKNDNTFSDLETNFD